MYILGRCSVLLPTIQVLPPSQRVEGFGQTRVTDGEDGGMVAREKVEAFRQGGRGLPEGAAWPIRASDRAMARDAAFMAWKRWVGPAIAKM